MILLLIVIHTAIPVGQGLSNKNVEGDSESYRSGHPELFYIPNRRQ